jgi:hypothetical protein
MSSRPLRGTTNLSISIVVPGGGPFLARPKGVSTGSLSHSRLDHQRVHGLVEHLMRKHPPARLSPSPLSTATFPGLSAHFTAFQIKNP